MVEASRLATSRSRGVPRATASTSPRTQFVSGDYFRAIRHSLRRGRYLTARDTARTAGQLKRFASRSSRRRGSAREAVQLRRGRPSRSCRQVPAAPQGNADRPEVISGDELRLGDVLAVGRAGRPRTRCRPAVMLPPIGRFRLHPPRARPEWPRPFARTSAWRFLGPLLRCAREATPPPLPDGIRVDGAQPFEAADQEGSAASSITARAISR